MLLCMSIMKLYLNPMTNGWSILRLLRNPSIQNLPQIQKAQVSQLKKLNIPMLELIDSASKITVVKRIQKSMQLLQVSKICILLFIMPLHRQIHSYQRQCILKQIKFILIYIKPCYLCNTIKAKRTKENYFSNIC